MTTKPTMALAELSENDADVDLLRQMIGFVAVTDRRNGAGDDRLNGASFRRGERTCQWA
jgi:hypothetical protein